jgi:hypothetical protein
MENSLFKICEICHKEFEPDYRVADRQRVCKKFNCQQERKRRAQHAWLKKNPGYFKGRYPELKDKILDRQKKLKTEKAKKLSVSSAVSATIQDELILNNNMLLTQLGAMLTIQDEITSKFIICNRHLHQLKTRLYKTIEPAVFKNVNRPNYTRQDCFSPDN